MQGAKIQCLLGIMTMLKIVGQPDTVLAVSKT